MFVCGLIEDATEAVREVMKKDPYLAAKCTTHAKGIDGKLVDALAIILIKNQKSRLEAGDWFAKLYHETLAILSIESKTYTKSMSALFHSAYNQSQEGLQNYSFMLIGMQLVEKAIAFLESLVNNRPDDIRLRNLLAWALRLAEKYEESILHDNECLELAPEYGWSLGGIGISYRELKKFEDSVLFLRRAIQANNVNFWAHSHLGFTLKEMQNYEDAFVQFQKAIDLDWNYSWPHLGLADLYLEYLKQPEKAIAEYEITLQLDQRPFWISKALYKLSLALETIGRITEARQRYEEYLDRFPWGEHAQEALAALKRLGED